MASKAKGEKPKFKKCTKPNCRGNCPDCQRKRDGR